MKLWRSRDARTGIVEPKGTCKRANAAVARTGRMATPRTRRRDKGRRWDDPLRGREKDVGRAPHGTLKSIKGVFAYREALKHGTKGALSAPMKPRELTERISLGLFPPHGADMGWTLRPTALKMPCSKRHSAKKWAAGSITRRQTIRWHPDPAMWFYIATAFFNHRIQKRPFASG